MANLVPRAFPFKNGRGQGKSPGDEVGNGVFERLFGPGRGEFQH